MGKKKVVILGGGVAGMSAAHELVDPTRGFDVEVEVYERRSIAGGKARSLIVAEPFGHRRLPGIGAPPSRPTVRSPKPWLPGEHGFRFFPRFYRHVVDTMRRIPFNGGCVADNLVDTTRAHIARFDKSPIMLPCRFPRSHDDLYAALSIVLGALGGQIGLPVEEIAYFTGRMWQILTSCEERRLSEYELINWWDFIDADHRSPAYQNYFGNAITRSLVAAKAERASTKTIGDIFLQIVFDVLTPGVSSDRLLNGPTNDVWIDPWLAHLRGRGVRYHFDASVQGINLDPRTGRVRSATIAKGGRTFEVEGDYFIGAVPVEKMTTLVSAEMLQVDPSLANLRELSEYVEWMNGIQYYLTEDVPVAHGHTIYMDSPWALTSVSQPQFWTDYKIGDFGDGRVLGLISVDISDWDYPGLNGKEADECTREEIAAETWEQMKRSLNVDGKVVLRDDMLHHWFLDPAIVDADPSVTGQEENAEPLLVNYVDTWRLRPEATTRIPNFFLAADYVRTFTDLATMEAANEAARRAVNGVIAAERSSAPPCELWNLHEPELFLPLRAYDRTRFRRGLSWDAQTMGLAQAALGLAATVNTLSTDEPTTQSLVDRLQKDAHSVLGTSSQLVSLGGEDMGAAHPISLPAAPAAPAPAKDPTPRSDETTAAPNYQFRRVRILPG